MHSPMKETEYILVLHSKSYPFFTLQWDSLGVQEDAWLVTRSEVFFVALSCICCYCDLIVVPVSCECERFTILLPLVVINCLV